MHGFLGGLTSVAFPGAALDCAFPQLTVYHWFLLYMLLPAFSLVIALAAYVYDRTLGFRPWRLLRLTAPARAQARARLVTRGRGPGHILLISLSVVLFLLYPTLNRQTTRLSRCDRYVFDAAPQKLLRDDYGVSCSSAVHHRMHTFSLVFFGAYGVGFPVGIPLAGLVMRRLRGEALEMATLSFMFVGFKKRYRYWEAVNMARKLLLVFVMTFVADLRLRAYTAIWTLSLFLVMQIVFEPAANPSLNRLDSHSLQVWVCCAVRS